jgi:hypothetical protein
LPSFLVFCQLTASNGQQLSFIFVSLKHLHLRAYEEIIPTMSRPVIGVVLRTCEGEKRVSPCFYVKCPQQGTYNILLMHRFEDKMEIMQVLINPTNDKETTRWK